MRDFRVGQRWASEAEPELGLGILTLVDERHVEIEFRASESRRRFAKATAPLRRVVFQRGDLVRTAGGEGLLVHDVEERDGLVRYVGESGSVGEDELSPVLGAETPMDRLRRGLVDPRRGYDLRQEAFAHLHRIRTSGVRGLLGARIELLPHQLYIAAEVARREAPRVLLADEVGLGKTIEACLVVHEMLLSGRAERVLVAVPEHLVHQWFVELLRRFDVRFKIFDEERCAAIETGARDGEGEDAPGGRASATAGGAAAATGAAAAGAAAGTTATETEPPNPFLDEQLVLCGLPLLSGDARRLAQAVEARWDVLVVDEAHHLAWRPGEASAEYAAVAGLAAASDAVLLLTGTPSQLGEEGHFARLRLLDPARHPDLERHRAEVAAYADIARRIEAAAAPPPALPDDGSIVAEPAASSAQDEDDVLDRYGPGRVMFRNTRASIGGFPRRVPYPARLVGPESAAIAHSLEKEIDLRGRRARGELAEVAFDYQSDPRVPWLAALLRELAPEKVLLICQTPEQVAAIADALSRVVTVKRAVFHEGMSLVQRDRNAAWFAEKDGARLLLCSEIGSEGRNFQFVRHLVLFDLPLDPELLEQRIGRLDRIGQRHDISLHVPLIPGSAQEVLYRWYADGLDAFARPVPDGNALLERFGGRVAELARRAAESAEEAGQGGGAAARALDALVEESRAARDELAERLSRGRDRLLERSSYRPARGQRLAADIARIDADPALADFMMRVFDHYGVEVEDLGDAALRLSTDRLYVDVFPGLPAEGLTVTFSRRTALDREDVTFLTWDHSMVLGAIDLLVGSASGTCAFVVAEGGGRPELLLEATFVLESPAPRRLGVDRFLPATPLRVAVDRELEDRSEELAQIDASALRDAPSALRDAIEPLVPDLFPRLLTRARALVEERAARVVAESLAEARGRLDRDVARLEALARENHEVRPQEIARLRERRREVEEHIEQARPRLDALRVVWRGSLPG